MNCQPGIPTCHCGYFGGFVADRCSCGERGGSSGVYGACDLAPPDWVSFTDEHGCRAYKAGPPTACCNCPRPRDGG